MLFAVVSASSLFLRLRPRLCCVLFLCVSMAPLVITAPKGIKLFVNDAVLAKSVIMEFLQVTASCGHIAASADESTIASLMSEKSSPKAAKRRSPPTAPFRDRIPSSKDAVSASPTRSTTEPRSIIHEVEDKPTLVVPPVKQFGVRPQRLPPLILQDIHMSPLETGYDQTANASEVKLPLLKMVESLTPADKVTDEMTDEIKLLHSRQVQSSKCSSPRSSCCSSTQRCDACCKPLNLWCTDCKIMFDFIDGDE